MDFAHRSVLLVDDDQTFLSTYAREFSRRKWRVSTACNGNEAPARARVDQPAVIVLDMMLGEESGLDLISELRHEAPGARIVVLTGSATISTAVDAMKLGADDYLEKPASVDQIIHSVDQRVAMESLAQSERAHIERVLHDVGGNVSEAARRLRMHRRTLQRKLRKSAPTR